MKGIMAYPEWFSKDYVYDHISKLRGLEKVSEYPKGSWKRKFRRKNKKYVCLCSTGILENFFFIIWSLPIYKSCFLHSVQKKSILRFWLLFCICCWRALMDSWSPPHLLSVWRKMGQWCCQTNNLHLTWFGCPMRWCRKLSVLWGTHQSALEWRTTERTFRMGCWLKHCSSTQWPL